MTHSFIRDGRGAVRPYVYSNLDGIKFIEEVLGATVTGRYETPYGFHIEAELVDSMIVLEAGDQFPAEAQANPGSIYVYVPDVDATYQTGLTMGATSISPPEDKPYEERQCGLRDSFGNTWWISTYTG